MLGLAWRGVGEGPTQPALSTPPAGCGPAHEVPGREAGTAEHLAGEGEPEQVGSWVGEQGRAWGAGTDARCPCRVLEALWELLLQAILQALGANFDVSADFYSRFHFTLEVGLRGGAPCLPSSRPCPRCPGR